jgi:hypothetical protein
MELVTAVIIASAYRNAPLIFPWTEVLQVPMSVFTAMPAYYLKLGHDRFLPTSFRIVTGSS